MTRDKKLEVRLTEEELGYIETMCKKLNISKSTYVRQCLSGSGNVDVASILQCVISIQTILNWMKLNGPSEELVSYMETELNKTWQFLR